MNVDQYRTEHNERIDALVASYASSVAWARQQLAKAQERGWRDLARKYRRALAKAERDLARAKALRINPPKEG